MGKEEVVNGTVGPVAALLGRSLRWLRPNVIQKAHPLNPALRWLVRRLMEETPNPDRAEAGIALRALKRQDVSHQADRMTGFQHSRDRGQL
jgi:hypothetical protein